MNFEKFTVSYPVTILECLKKIDANEKGFLVVIDKESRVIGTISDGDIQRALIKGKEIKSDIDSVYTSNFKSLKAEDNISVAIELFEKYSIKFLPVISKESKLLNIITKSQLHTLLLRDIHTDLMYEFENLDEDNVNYEICLRPWGFYKTIVTNDYCKSKVISINPKSQLSLQSHDRRDEHWIVVHGVGTAQFDQSIIDLHRGSYIFIPNGCKHRLTNTDDKQNLIITEVQIGDYFGEDDIHRYEDIYGRI